MLEKIEEYLRKKRKPSAVVKQVEIKQVELPWYKKPINKDDFHTKKAIAGKYYVQHNAWSKRTWIGPYETTTETDNIINSYVIESLKGSLERKPMDSVHSIVVDDNSFFNNDSN